MKKYYIFLDTNIIQHTLTHHEKEKFIWLHKLNADFYDIGSLYILPQVQVELVSHDIKIMQWNSLFSDTFELYLLDDTFEFHHNFLNNIFSFILNLGISKPNGYEDLIADATYYLENMYNEALEFQEALLEINKLAVTKLWVDFSHQKNYSNIGTPLANIVELSIFWEILYRGFTYRDIFRSTGNFMFDYKNYKNKWERQKWKVWKDAQVICELVLWLDYIKSIPVDDNIIFLTSDYWFIKELAKFKSDIFHWALLESEYYKWLSVSYISQLKLVMQNLKVIKLDPVNFTFENDLWLSYKVLELL